MTRLETSLFLHRTFVIRSSFGSRHSPACFSLSTEVAAYSAEAAAKAGLREVRLA
jgi:hypothetical protein